MLRAILILLSFFLATPLFASTQVLLSEDGALERIQLHSGFDDAQIAEAPSYGRVELAEGVLQYWADQGFEGHDRIEVTNSAGTRHVVHVIVGDPRPPQVDVIYGYLGALLFALAVVAIFLELAFTLMFNNRAFRRFGWFPGIKTLIAFLGSLAVVWVFNFDIFGEVMRAISAPDAFLPGAGYVSGAITAMLLAGGSGTIFYLYTRLGIRNPFSQGLSGGAERGVGHLRFAVTREVVGDAHPIGVSLKTSDGVDFLGAIPVGSSQFGGTHGREIAAGVYTLLLEGQSDAGTPEAKQINLVISSAETFEPAPIAF
ncbi:MAG: hypothetical protein AAFR93_10715 [Pseudomonadota bacterium]